MTLQVLDCEQGSPEWYAARAGIPTASEFATILAKGKDGGASVTRKTYMLKLAGERLTGEPMESHSNGYMDRGKSQEPEARALYAFANDVEPQVVGFIRNGDAGCSPDALIGSAGMLEIKTAAPHILIGTLTRDGFPAEHVAQCQGALWIAEREWIDIAVYHPRLPLFTKRAVRDEVYIRDLARAVDAFNAELSAVVDRVRRYGEPVGAQLAASLGSAA